MKTPYQEGSVRVDVVIIKRAAKTLVKPTPNTHTPI